jgi:hemerythrin HHE cation binding domain-containing protein
MPTDFLSLVQRDHVDLQSEITRLLDADATVSQLRSSLDGVRLGLTAHAEAEDIVLGRFAGMTALEMLVAQARAAHRSQESALSALVSARLGTTAWRERAHRLRELVQYHAVQEAQELLPALRLHAPRALYDSLAGAFATERLRQLAMLQPSAPIYITDLGKPEVQFS